MDRNEAIKWIHAIKVKYIHGGDDGFDEMRKCALDMAIAALLTQAEAEKNEPLTMEELREMDGEPIYVIRAGNGRSCYYIAKSVGTGLDLYRGGSHYESFCDYGKTWWAYLRKPEDVAE